jgi:hypothetical protein
MPKSERRKLPKELTPLNLKAWLYEGAGLLCGCSDHWAVINTLGGLLTWFNTDCVERESYDKLFGGNTGLFYLLAGVLDDLGLQEHGTSCRVGFLTDDGKRLLKAITSLTEEQWDSAVGEAHDGVHYD